MSNVGQRERATQQRVVQLLQRELGYTYLGNWHTRPGNSHIEEGLLREWLQGQGYSEALIGRALYELDKAATIGDGRNLYTVNQAVYSLLRYGVKVKEGAGEQTQTVWLIDWQNPANNSFALAEEVSIQGKHKKRPDIVFYVNGLALALLELKRATVSISEGIQQNLSNQQKTFIEPFFATMQLVMAGNDTEGLRYGTIETREKYYLTWQEENPDPQAAPGARYLPSHPCAAGSNPLDCALLRLMHPPRFLELVHDFIVFDQGTKKIPRHNQYFGVKAAQARIQRREGGIIWHTQGSGKSLTMVWLAKWIRENVPDSRVVIITDRTELDDQIEGVFMGVGEKIYRTQSGADLLTTLDSINPWLICSLVHKFGRPSRRPEDDIDDFIAELQQNLHPNFSPKGKIFVFVDECHRTQSGKLHEAMKVILPHSLFIGFTGTPLLKKDKQKSVEIFGSYIHTYKFDTAVADGVVLDLQYEARDIDQRLTSPRHIDTWFEANTRELTDMAKAQLKQRWGTLREVLSSRDRLDQIVNDILLDMATKPRLMDSRGNAMLVCASIYQACKVYELFTQTELKGKCAIITSYKPSPADIKGEETGEGLTEKLHQYDIYRRMLADYFDQNEDEAMTRVEEFEQRVKKQFIHEPGQMRLLIVVDKLLTGFDAPSATYLYIDKKMQDHGLFQAICRVNRLDGEDKDYGYIVDYRDLFHSLEGAIQDYTGGAFEAYDAADVAGLLSNRLDKGRDRLEEALEQVHALCEPVLQPRDDQDYVRYFCGDPANPTDLPEREAQRLALYKLTAALIRAYANLANELGEAGYTPSEVAQMKAVVTHYTHVRDMVKHVSGDYIDLKQYEPTMRRMIDQYIRAEPSQKVSDFDNLGLVELIVAEGLDTAVDSLPPEIQHNEETMAETIENNIRKVIIDERPVNPKYYDAMSDLLDALIQDRKEKAVAYGAYLARVKELSAQVLQRDAASQTSYPAQVNSRGKRALYDNLGRDEALVVQLDAVVRQNKQADWVGHKLRERELAYKLRTELESSGLDWDFVMGLLKEQDEYK